MDYRENAEDKESIEEKDKLGKIEVMEDNESLNFVEDLGTWRLRTTFRT